MAYSLHIEREDSEVTLEEWIATISSIDGARIKTEDSRAINPATGEEIVFASTPGDVEIKFYSGGFLGIGRKISWELCIWFSEGRASFKASKGIESTRNPIHRVAALAASKLSASIVGDEGEQYKW